MEVLLNQLVFFSFFQGLVLLCLYIFSPKNRRNISGYLAFLVAVLMIGLSGRILNITEVFGVSSKFIAVSEFSNLLFGSTAFLFTRSSLLDKKFSSKDLIHYVPAIIYSSLIVVMFIIPSSAEVKARYADGGLFEHIVTFIGFALVFNIGYWIASCITFWRFKNEMDNELSHFVKTKFFRNFLLAIGLCLLVWTVLYGSSFFYYEFLERDTRGLVWTSISMVILFISFYTLREPELFRINQTISAKKYAASRLNEIDLDELKEQLQQLMLTKKPYLNRKLMKADLSRMLGINQREMSRLLNESIGMNFFEYVNYYRIMEFVSLAKTEKSKQLTFFGIAQEAGFNSKTTFNKSFKTLMGVSPSVYFNQIESQ